jgi:hypothetical protein
MRWVAEYPAGRARVGTDQIADMLHDETGGDEDDVNATYAELHTTVALQGAIRALLRAGVDVVCDDTNLLPSHINGLRAVANDCRADFEVWDMTDVDVETCIERDEARGLDGGRMVGGRRIRAMRRRHRIGTQKLPTTRNNHVRTVYGQRQIRHPQGPWICGEGTPRGVCGLNTSRHVLCEHATAALNRMPVRIRVTHLRLWRGLSQQELGDLTGRTKSWVEKVESGICGLDRVSVLVQLADALRVDPLLLLPLPAAPYGAAQRATSTTTTGSTR